MEFLGQRGEAVHVKMIQRAVTHFARATGLKGVTPYTLRHTFAKGLIDNEVGLEKVAALLGNERLNTTRIYTTPGLQDLVAAEEEVAGGFYPYISPLELTLQFRQSVFTFRIGGAFTTWNTHM